MCQNRVFCDEEGALSGLHKIQAMTDFCGYLKKEREAFGLLFLFY